MPAEPERSPTLFRRWPALREKIPWTPLGTFPTPVEPMTALGERIGREDLWVKRDDLSGARYGGNKVRKLEFTLADATRKGARSLITAGAVGSNHVVAAAIYGARLGLDVTAVLVPQPNQENLRTNLLMSAAHGARLEPVGSGRVASLRALSLIASEARRNRKAPYLLWVGGSSFLGVLGYMEFAFELERQVRAGELPEPAAVVLPVGSGGTMAGIVAGLKLTSLRTRVVGVRVFERSFANPYVVTGLATRGLRMLRRIESTFPDVRVRPADVTIVGDYFGKGYARYTRKGVEAMELIGDTEDLKLEGTYSGKAAAGFLDLAKLNGAGEGPLLFVHTYNSRPIEPLLVGAPDPRDLHPMLRSYFTSPIATVDEV